MTKEAKVAFETEYRASGKPFNAGKSCVRFKSLSDLPLDLIGKVIASMTMKEFIDRVNKLRLKR